MSRKFQMSVLTNGLVVAGACFAMLAITGTARAEDSNRNEVRSNLSKGGWTVVWGKNFTERDWVEGSGSIAASVSTNSPQPFLKWFGRAMDENFAKIKGNVPGATLNTLKQCVLQSLQKKNVIRYKGLRIQAGFATYNRWQTVSYNEPRTRKVKKSLPFGGWTWGIETYTARVEKKIPLPNWHQFYIRYQLVRG